MELTVTNRSRAYPGRSGWLMKRWRWFQYVVLKVCCARVAQWWSIALPRRGSRVRIPSRALKEIEKRVIRWMALFSMFKPSRARTVRSPGSDLFIAGDIMCDQKLFIFSEKTSNFWFLCYNALLWKNPMYKTRWMRWRKKYLCLLAFFYWAYALPVCLYGKQIPTKKNRDAQQHN